MRGLSPGPDLRLLQTEATKPLLQSAGLVPGTWGREGWEVGEKGQVALGGQEFKRASRLGRDILA